MADQRARIQFGNHRDSMLAQKLASFLVRSPIAGDAGKLTQSSNVRMRGFVVRRVGPVITDLRISQDYDLPGIGRIAEYFLVAGDDLAGRTKTPALEYGAVFQGEDGGWQLDGPPDAWIKPILAGSSALE
jgi:hypothetical protein